VILREEVGWEWWEVRWEIGNKTCGKHEKDRIRRGGRNWKKEKGGDKQGKGKEKF
jgi:hypothetical protein